MSHEDIYQSTQVTFFNVVPSSRDDRDTNAEPSYDEITKVPHYLDLRKYLQPVRNQGVQGTSLACAAATIVEWYARKVDKSSILASPQYLYDNRNDAKTTLVSGRDTMEILKNKGCCSEELHTYGSTEAISEEANKDALKNKISSFAKVRTMDTLKKALMINGPCVVCFPVYNHTTELWKQHRNEQKLGGHAMAIVGYNKKGFILRNSWGQYWEKDGHCLYPYEDWGSHDEIWTAFHDKSLDKWKQRRSMSLRALSIFSLKDVNQENEEEEAKVEDGSTEEKKAPESLEETFKEGDEKVSGENEMNK